MKDFPKTLMGLLMDTCLLATVYYVWAGYINNSKFQLTVALLFTVIAYFIYKRIDERVVKKDPYILDDEAKRRLRRQ